MKYLVGFSADQSGLEALQLAAVLARTTRGSLVVCTLVPEAWDHPSLARIDQEYASFLYEYADRALANARAELPADIQADFIARSVRSPVKDCCKRPANSRLIVLYWDQHARRSKDALIAAV
jgi:hypothetical protein